MSETKKRTNADIKYTCNLSKNGPIQPEVWYDGDDNPFGLAPWVYVPGAGTKAFVNGKFVRNN